MINKYIIVVFVLCNFCFANVFAASFRKLGVDPPLRKKIKAIVEMAKDLHEYSYTSNNGEIKLLLIKLEDKVKLTKKIIIDDGPSAKHLLKLFITMENSFKKAQSLDQQAQKDVLKLGFESIVRVTQRFDVGNYRTFYCQTYKDLWIQRSWVVKNPVHPKSRCGVLVN